MNDRGDSTVLQVDGLVSGYGKKEVLHNISFRVVEKEIVALIGHNGAGKSTVLKTIVGLLPCWKGQILFKGEEISRWPTTKKVKAGIRLVPQGRQVFTELSVRENLEMGGYILDKATLVDRIDFVFHFFPILAKRQREIAGKLSGGEQQMLAFASALIIRPHVLLLDEPSLGLSPNLVKKTFSEIQKISSEFKIPILIVEQKVRKVMSIADRTCVLKLGKVTYDGPSDDLSEKRLRKLYL